MVAHIQNAGLHLPDGLQGLQLCRLRGVCVGGSDDGHLRGNQARSSVSEEGSTMEPVFFGHGRSFWFDRNRSYRNGAKQGSLEQIHRILSHR
jgi:hypothetical protein